ncbi:hypothetical protein GCM10009551_095460 [Nocardiopsis tropica]
MYADSGICLVGAWKERFGTFLVGRLLSVSFYPGEGPASPEKGSIQVASTRGGSLARGGTRAPFAPVPAEHARALPATTPDGAPAARARPARHVRRKATGAPRPGPPFVGAARYKGHAPHQTPMALETQEMSE